MVYEYKHNLTVISNHSGNAFIKFNGSGWIISKKVLNKEMNSLFKLF